MLSKLIKHELTHWVRTFMVVYIIYGILVVLEKIFLTVTLSYGTNVADEHTFVYIMFGILGFSVMMYSVMLPWASVIHNVNRFKKNMFSDEGYLSNTLPVTPAEHIAAKLIMGGISYIVSSLLIVACIYLMFIGVDVEDVEFNVMFKYVSEIISQNVGQMILGFILSCSIFAGIMLLSYLAEGVAAINGGKKIISTAIAIVGVISAMIISGIITTLLRTNGYDGDSIQRTIAQIIFYLLADTGMFFLLSYILKNKLNLE